MGEMLEALHRLQKVERKLAQIRLKRHDKERKVSFHRRQAAKAEEKLQSNKHQKIEHQKRLDSLQLEITTREESIDKHRQALNRAKTNKEYAAILAAMNTEKADNAKIETEMLQLMETIQRLADEQARIEGDQAKLLAGLAQAEEELDRFDQECQGECAALQGEHDQCAQHIEPTALGTFTRVAEHFDGDAMAIVEKINPKREEYLCTGCHMKVTLEVVNALLTRNELQVCRVCGRILYFKPPTVQKLHS